MAFVSKRDKLMLLFETNSQFLRIEKVIKRKYTSKRKKNLIWSAIAEKNVPVLNDKKKKKEQVD